MPIRYKVVNKDRESCFCSSSTNYSLVYQKGKVVKKHKGTVGIFVFKTRKQAEAFMDKHPWYVSTYKWKIVKVNARGRGTSMRTRPTHYGDTGITLFMKVFRKYKHEIIAGQPIDSCALFNTCKIEYGMRQYNDGTMVYDSVIPLD